jgi:hypothetical protein
MVVSCSCQSVYVHAIARMVRFRGICVATAAAVHQESNVGAAAVHQEHWQRDGLIFRVRTFVELSRCRPSREYPLVLQLSRVLSCQRNRLGETWGPPSVLDSLHSYAKSSQLSTYSHSMWQTF